MSNNNESIKASRVAAVSTKVLTDSKNKIKAIAEKFSLYGKIAPKSEESTGPPQAPEKFEESKGPLQAPEKIKNFKERARRRRLEENERKGSPQALE